MPTILADLDSPGGQRSRAGTLYGVGALVLVLLLALAGALGGFGKRTDQLRTSPPGTLVTTGPYELQFSEATAQSRVHYDGRPIWEITMMGTGP